MEGAMTGWVKVFVYGTLKPGEENFEAYCLGCPEALEAIAYGELYDLPFDYPAMTRGDRVIYGYLLTLDASVLPDLDELEGYDASQPDAQNEYIRQEIEVFNLAGRSLGIGWAYLMSAEQAIDSGGQLLPGGKWTSRTRQKRTQL